MLKRNNRKGFTLAELLIVVAIIAVLVAIAVPLFVTGIQKAQKATEDANVRAVRSTAVATILLNEKKDTYDYMYAGGTSAGDSKEATQWTVEAIITPNGDIRTMYIIAEAPTSPTSASNIEKINEAGALGSTGHVTAVANDVGGYYVTLTLIRTDLTEVQAKG